MPHYPGYNEALQRTQRAELPELLRLIDDMYGRDRLYYGASVEEVREEALRQLDIEWTDTSHPDHTFVQAMGKIARERHL